MSLIGYESHPSAAAGNVVVTVPAASLTLTRFAPVIKLGIVVPAASLTLTTFAPVIKSAIVVPAASLTLTTFAPTVTATLDVLVTVPAASLALTTFAPLVNLAVIVPPASLTLTTFAPTVTVAAGDVTVVIPSASLTLTTFPPTVTVTTTVVAGQDADARGEPLIIGDYHPKGKEKKAALTSPTLKGKRRVTSPPPKGKAKRVRRETPERIKAVQDQPISFRFDFGGISLEVQAVIELPIKPYMMPLAVFHCPAKLEMLDDAAAIAIGKPHLALAIGDFIPVRRNI